MFYGIGLVCGKKYGGIIGATYGIIYDIYFSKTFGIYTLLFAMLGSYSGRLFNKVSVDNKMTLVYMTFVSTLVFESLILLLNIILYKNDFYFWYYIKVLSFEVIYNIFISNMLYKYIYFLGDNINKCKSDYYELRKF